jgi:hypothetical protein
MPGFPLLDTAIGLAFVYLLLSLICTSINEGLESLFRNRANDLESGVRNLLGDNIGSWWMSFLPWTNSIQSSSITREFYLHPLIRNLFLRETKLPSYIPSHNFALAIMDMVSDGGKLVRGATQPSTGSPVAFEMATTVNGVALPERLTESINALVSAANGDVQQARLNIENWFNSSMDRVSGGYKARTQKILFCLGAVVTLLLNADSINIFHKLSKSKDLQAIVSAASSATNVNTPSGQSTQTQISTAMAQLNALNLGLGWENDVIPKDTSQVNRWFQLLYAHGVGWFITAAAISLGAPFWFDTLNRFMVVRSTVKPEEKSPDEGSKD